MTDEKRFADFARLGADWFWETDREDRYTYFCAAEPDMAPDLSDRIGRTRRDFAPLDADNLARLESIESAIQQRRSFRRMLYRAGSRGEPASWCEISGEPKYDEAGLFDGYRGIGREVTTLIETKRALDIKSEVLDVILQTLPDGVHLFDGTGKRVAVNERYFEILGLANRVAALDQGTTYAAFLEMAQRGEYGPGDPETLARDRFQALFERVRSEGNVAYRRQLKGGRWVEGRFRGLDDGGVLSIYRDITELMRRETELERQAAILSTIFANIDGGIAVFDKDNCLSAWNERFGSIIGIDPALLRQGLSLREVLVEQARVGEFGPCDPEVEADRRLPIFWSAEPTVTERKRPNSTTVERRRSPIPGGGSVTIYIDVTDRRRTEEQLKELNATLERRIAERTETLAEAERFQRSLISNLPGMVYRCRNDRDWTMLFASGGCRDLLGLAPTDLLDGATIYKQLIHPEDQEMVLKKAQADFAVGDAFEVECRMRHADGNWRWVLNRAQAIRSDDGEVTALEGVILNIDARKTAERELARTRDHLFDAVDSLDHGMILYDRDDRLVLFTRRAEDHYAFALRNFKLGQTFEEMLRDTIMRGATPTPPGVPVEQFIAERVAQHKRADGSVVVRETPEGRVLHISEYRSQSGGIVAIGRDVTEKLQIDRQLREAQRMEAIGQLTGGLAHDLNNYLAVIIGNLDMLAERKQFDPEVPKLIEGAVGGALRGAELTRSLLAFSRRQPLAPKLLDIGQRIAEVVELLKRTIGERIVVRTDLAADLWRVKIDGTQLDSSIVNLANNARDAMPNGGTLTIRACNMPAGGNGATPAGDQVLLEFTDTGKGMTPDTLARAFEPFFSTKGPGHGTGLGLSMVHGFVYQSGGTIEIASTEGSGTVVRILLPRALSESPPSEARPGRVALPGGSESILVVEDNDDMRDTAVEQLTSLGYRVTSLDSADKALASLEKDGAGIDLVFTDMVMPGTLDGFDLAKLVAERWPSCRILLTTGYSSDLIDGIEQGTEAFALLRKPYRKAELARAVRACLEKSK